MKVAAFLGKFSIFYAICASKNSDELSVNIDHVYCKYREDIKSITHIKH